jgi:hypothetical protein
VQIFWHRLAALAITHQLVVQVHQVQAHLALQAADQATILQADRLDHLLQALLQEDQAIVLQADRLDHLLQALLQEDQAIVLQADRLDHLLQTLLQEDRDTILQVGQDLVHLAAQVLQLLVDRDTILQDQAQGMFLVDLATIHR